MHHRDCQGTVRTLNVFLCFLLFIWLRVHFASLPYIWLRADTAISDNVLLKVSTREEVVEYCFIVI